MLSDDNDTDFGVLTEVAGLTEGLRSWLGEDLDEEALELLFDFVEQHRINARKRGINFPKLVALVIPRLGWIKLVRHEIPESSIRRAVLALLRECPKVTREEVAQAVKRAWPHYKLTSVIDEAETKLVGV